MKIKINFCNGKVYKNIELKNLLFVATIVVPPEKGYIAFSSGPFVRLSLRSSVVLLDKT